MKIISVRNVTKNFTIGRGLKKTLISSALNNVSLEVSAGDFVIIYGPSGCGKSTLLNTIIGLEPPDTGNVIVHNQDVYMLDEGRRAILRNSRFGVIYQQPIWVKSLSVLENVALPLLIKGENKHRAITRAKLVLEDFGLGDRLYNRPVEISGGQQQKAATARALIHNPRIIIADEPTGNLDTHSADELTGLFIKINHEYHRTIIMVTHNLGYLPMANKQIAMIDGQITTEKAEVAKQIDQQYQHLMSGRKY